MLRLDWRRKLAAWPSQSPGLAEAAGLTRAQLDSAAWAIRPNGLRLRGAAAIYASLDAILPFGLPFFITLYRLPGLGALSDRAYAWIADHRDRFPGTPICSLRPPEPLSAEARDALVRRVGGKPPVAG
jgi:predicted DCC family thiol-disulfide oxidoreductase YuxK